MWFKLGKQENDCQKSEHSGGRWENGAAFIREEPFESVGVGNVLFLN